MQSTDYARVAEAIRFLERHAERQPDLAEVAGAVGLSEYHFHRLFRRWAGITPKRFLQFVTAAHARALLRGPGSVLDATYALGLSSPSRLHELVVNVDGVTPGQVKAGGRGLTIGYGVHESPFGDCLLAMTPHGICGLTFVEDGALERHVDDLRARWPAATLEERPRETSRVARRIFARTEEAGPPPLLVRGTNFQVKVWEALLRVPAGSVTTYGELARAIGQPSASRAVGAAVGQNRIAFLIPCHRVIRGTGAFGGYRWGVERKAAMLAWEELRKAEVG
jgi:AraC family transcriptional regulator, regulatory protein of adaptative response / methylated-DNA-[protein]-cysteine methyltransferase